MTLDLGRQTNERSDSKQLRARGGFKRFSRLIEKAEGIHQGKGEFEEFVRIHHERLETTIGRLLKYNDFIEVEDVLQEALERMWRQWKLWPKEPAERLKYALRTLRCTAIDATRRVQGRHGRRPENILVDFQSMATNGKRSEAYASSYAIADVRAALMREPLRKQEEAVLERKGIADACRTLTKREIKILLSIGLLGQSYQETANDLSIPVEQVAGIYLEARHLLSKLIGHAGALGELSVHDREQLSELFDGKLAGRELRVALRHYKHCTTCQRLVESSGI